MHALIGMKILYEDLWELHADGHTICITTNGFVKSNGECVMGRGCAKECAQRYTHFPRTLGRLIKRHGNIPFIIGDIITVPVKHHWAEKADKELILSSFRYLLDIPSKLKPVYCPLPGCGNGQLAFEDVKDICEYMSQCGFIFVDKPKCTH